jgi:hypothetical protein
MPNLIGPVDAIFVPGKFKPAADPQTRASDLRVHGFARFDGY